MRLRLVYSVLTESNKCNNKNILRQLFSPHLVSRAEQGGTPPVAKREHRNPNDYGIESHRSRGGSRVVRHPTLALRYGSTLRGAANQMLKPRFIPSDATTVARRER